MFHTTTKGLSCRMAGAWGRTTPWGEVGDREVQERAERKRRKRRDITMAAQICNL